MSEVTGRWLLVEWDDESREVVNMRSWVDSDQEMKVGDELNFNRRNGVTRRGKLIAASDDRKYLQEQLVKMLKSEHPLEDQHDFNPEIVNGHRPGTPIVYRSKTYSCKTETPNRLESSSRQKSDIQNGNDQETPNNYMTVMSKGYKSESPNGCIIVIPNNGCVMSDTSNGLNESTPNGYESEKKQKPESPLETGSATPNGSISESNNGYRSETEKKPPNGFRTQTPNGSRCETPNGYYSGTDKKQKLSTPNGAISETPNGSKSPNDTRSGTDTENKIRANTLNRCILETPNGPIRETLKRLRSESLNDRSSQSPKPALSKGQNPQTSRSKSANSAKENKSKTSNGNKSGKQNGPKVQPEQELEQEHELDAVSEQGQDYSSSGSSWGPEEQDLTDSEDEEVVPSKKIKRDLVDSPSTTCVKNNRKRTASKRTPSLRAKAVIPTPHKIRKSREKRKKEGAKVKTKKAKGSSKRHSNLYSKYVQLKKKQKHFALKTQKEMEELGFTLRILTTAIEQMTSSRTPTLDSLNILLFAGIHVENSENNLIPSALLEEHNYCAASSGTSNPVDNQGVQDVELMKAEVNKNPSQTLILAGNPEPDTTESVVKVDENISLPPAATVTSVPENNELNISEKPSLSSKKTKRPTKPKSSVKKSFSPPYAFSYSHDAKDSQDDEMIAIGSGKTLVKKHLFDSIDWSTHTMATRKLLSFVFPRSVLGSHSLTGKKSAAFADKPAKLCLNPRKVNDIVMTVVTKCNVKPNLVRSAITTKCADEYKRAQALKKAAALTTLKVNNKENIQN